MKKLSRKIVWLLLIVFVFTVGSGFSVRRSAALPGVGEQLSGFRVETIERLDTPGGKTAYLTHEATGAAVVYIEDTGASTALTLMARTTDGLRRVTLTADSAAELLRGAKESLGAFFGAETEAVPDAEAAYRAFLTYLLPGSDTAGNGAGPVSAENMLAVVCADADGAEDILSWLDGVFSAADAGEELAPDAAYRRIEKPVKETVSLAGEGTGGVYFGIVCPRAGEWTRVRLVALAAALKAAELVIYTDVDGIFSSDPRICQNAVRREVISYDDMLLLAQKGAQVLHDRSVALAQAGGVPITVRSCREDGNGSIVCETDEDASVVGVTQKKSGRSRLAAITAVGGALPSIEKEKIAVTALERAEITVFAVAAGERFMSFYVLRDDAERALQLVHDALIAAKE